jgi:hypothetical protein
MRHHDRRSEMLGVVLANRFARVVALQPGDILSVVECGPVQTVDKLSLPSWIRTEDGWLVDTVRSSR